MNMISGNDAVDKPGTFLGTFSLKLIILLSPQYLLVPLQK